MTGFITIAVLVCQISSGKNSSYRCYEKGSSNIRSEQILSISDIKYVKCNYGQFISCDDTVWDGCLYKMKLNYENRFSGETCQ